MEFQSTRMTHNIAIRQATLDDLPILLEFEQGIIDAERPFDPTLGPNPLNYYDLKELISSKDASVVVAVRDTQVIASGYATIKKARHYLDHKEYAYLGFMFTHRDFRGQGINTQIIDTLKEWAMARGLTEIRLTVYQENEAAIRAYEKYGFDRHLIEMRLPRS